MSDLFIPSYSTKCQGWTNPNNLVFGPQIVSLSSFYSPAGSTTLVSISGANFYSYSSISFGTYYPTVYFINSNILEFYVPSTLNAGTYTIQVFNGSFASNIVNYTIDNASGYWILESNNSIMNTNNNSVSVSSLSRGAPVTVNENNTPYTVPSDVNWIICYYEQTSLANGIVLELPTGSIYAGREIMIKSITNNAVTPFIPPVVSSLNTDIISINGVPGNYSPTNTIINTNTTTGWVTLVYDGTYWVVMQNGNS
jgi:hypothetical protein